MKAAKENNMPVFKNALPTGETPGFAYDSNGVVVRVTPKEPRESFDPCFAFLSSTSAASAVGIVVEDL